MLESLKKHIDVIPLYTVLLIFIGYWNLYTYYKHFNIEIYNYVTTGEILLGCLSISIYIFYAGSFLIAFNIFIWIQVVSDTIRKENVADNLDRVKDNDEFNKIYLQHEKDRLNIKKGFKRLFNKEEYSNHSWYKNIFWILIQVANLCISIILVVVLPIISLIPFYWLMKDQTNIFINYTAIPFYLSFLIFYLFAITENYFDKLKNANLKKFVSSRSKIILIGFSLIFFILFNNYRKAYKVITHHPISEVKFQVDSIKYSTSDTLYYIGQTQNYLFLKDFKKEDVIIFNKANIKNISLKNLD